MSAITPSFLLRTAAVVSFGALLAACGEEAKPPAATVFTAMPSDAALAQVYDSSGSKQEGRRDCRHKAPLGGATVAPFLWWVWQLPH